MPDLFDAPAAKAQLRTNVKAFLYLIDTPVRVEEVGEEMTKRPWRDMTEGDRSEIRLSMFAAGWEKSAWPKWRRRDYAVAKEVAW
jgi:hypothetical protein